jgi:hypothetical protein
VASHVVSLQDLDDIEGIQEALNGLPDGLDQTYDRMLRNIELKRRKQVANTLKWLAFSISPLYLDEVAEIFVLDPERDVPLGTRLLKPEAVLEYLRGLVTTIKLNRNQFHSEGSFVQLRLAHFSIQEYLLSNPTRMPIDISVTFQMEELREHSFITESSLAYHLHLSKTTLVTEQNVEYFPLCDYVARYWFRHLRNLPSPSKRIKGLVLQVFGDDQAFQNMQRLCSNYYGFRE